MALLQVENLTFRYPDAEKTALRNVSFSVRQGEFAVLCGLSGCGKSTLLRLMKREISPFGEKQGRIVYDGIETEELDGGGPAPKSVLSVKIPKVKLSPIRCGTSFRSGLKVSAFLPM